MSPAAPAGPNQPAYVTDPVALPGLLQQLVADLADPTISYLLGGHYYERTNHPRTRHFPAVFMLQQDEVRNVEVGVDFVAFDTQFVRYPERGEPGYPDALPDQFRATVPFTQLYQLCRKVLTPTEQTTAEVNYGPETIIYYNAAVYKHYPTPADIYQAYAAVPPTGEHPLGAVLAAVEAGLADSTNHYLVNTTAFESPAGPVLLGMLHLQTHTVRDLIIGDQDFTCSVLFNPNDRQEWSPMRVAFDQVWQVLHSNSPQMNLEEVEAAGGLLYYAPEVLSAYAQQGRTT